MSIGVKVKMKHSRSFLLCLVIGLGSTVSNGATILFQDNFDTDPTSDWLVNPSFNGVDFVADFFFDYSSVGIPPAPNSAGTTRGLKLQANLTSGVFGGGSVSPIGQFFEGDYRLRFDMWLNYNGPLGPSPAGGNGSTQVTGAGIGTAGFSAQWADSNHDSVHFGTTGDAGSTADYRAYSSAARVSYQDGDPVYFATTRNGNNPYYQQFGGASAPAAQQAIFDQQTGETAGGAQGFVWRNVTIDKLGTDVTSASTHCRSRAST